jgi:hypothetical protein
VGLEIIEAILVGVALLSLDCILENNMYKLTCHRKLQGSQSL